MEKRFDLKDQNTSIAIFSEFSAKRKKEGNNQNSHVSNILILFQNVETHKLEFRILNLTVTTYLEVVFS